MKFHEEGDVAQYNTCILQIVMRILLIGLLVIAKFMCGTQGKPFKRTYKSDNRNEYWCWAGSSPRLPVRPIVSTFGPYRIQRKDLKTIRLALYDQYLQLVLHACVAAGRGREETQHMNHFGLARHRRPSSIPNRKPHDGEGILLSVSVRLAFH